MPFIHCSRFEGKIPTSVRALYPAPEGEYLNQTTAMTDVAKKKIRFYHRYVRLLFAAGVFLLSCSIGTDYAFAEDQSSYGKITGRVIDEKTGDLLPSVNIMIEGTRLGSTTNFKGEFYILGVPTGTYTLRLSAIGFSTVRVSDVRISSGLETVVDIRMSPAPINLTPEVIIDAERIEAGRLSTGTIHIIDEEEIERLPVENVLDLIGILPGVVDNTFVRGGRASDIDYQIDGVSVRDFLFGSLPGGILINNLALKEIQIFTGGFRADYGNAMSGIVNLVTRESGDRWNGEIRVKNSFSALNGSHDSAKLNSRGERIIDFVSGGPLNIAGHPLRIFFSGRANTQSNRSPGLNIRDPLGNNITNYPRNALSQTNFFGKASMQATQNTKLTFAVYSAYNNYEEDSWFWRYNMSKNSLPSVSQQNNMAYLHFSHIFSRNFLVEAGIEYVDKQNLRGIQNNSVINSLWTDLPITPAEEDEIPVIYGTHNPYGVSGLFVSQGVLGSYWKTRARYYGANLHAMWQLNNMLFLKTGAEWRTYDLVNDYRGASFEEPTYQHDQYIKSPIDYSGYVTSTVRFAGLRVDGGIRMYYIDAKNPPTSFSATGVRHFDKVNPKKRISPRIGLSYMLRNNIVAHANYGTNNQPPVFHSLYAGTANWDLSSEERIEGNPHLDFQQSRFIETGFTFTLSDKLTFDVTGYAKRLHDLEEILMTPSAAASSAEFSNKGHSNVEGLELTLSRKRRDNFALEMSYTYSRAKGTLSFVEPQEPYKISNELPQQFQNIDLSRAVFGTSLVEYYLPFDRRHNFRAIVDLVFPDYRGPKVMGKHPFSNLSVNMNVFAESGTPYTRQDFQGNFIGAINAERHPWYFNSDMRIRKSIPNRWVDMTLFMDIRNVLNLVRPRYHYPVTGNPDYPGIIEPVYPLTPGSGTPDNNDPLSYSEAADQNNDGVIDTREQDAAYQHFLADFVRLKTLYQKPREVWIGVKFSF
ncbi:TonB-dependent receptor domain-containing protein [candidate division KSB1 bacterium]